jgi:hypothetical protein
MLARVAAASLLLAGARALPAPAATAAAATTLAPSDPRVKYFGRVDHSSPQQPKFAWVMTGAACTFTTTGAATVSASFAAPKDGARVRVMIDGTLARLVKVEAGPDGESSFKVSAAGDPAGYSCAANTNYEGERKCFEKGCPLTNIATVDACAGHCNATKGCEVIVHNKKGECYLKSDYTTSLPDDPSQGTVSCATAVGHHTPPPPGPADSYTLGSVTAAGTHTLEVFKVTEDNTKKGSQGSMSFGGFSLSAGSFGPAPPSESRRLEFIGDSDTAGWCADGSAHGGDNADKYQDGYQTWAMQIARNVSAGFMVEAVSGFGVEPSTPAIQPIIDFTLGFDPSGGMWNYSSWVPDAVVILIGPNDEVPMLGRRQQQRGAGRGGSKFIKDYLQLRTQVAKNYKGVPVPPKIVHVCGGSLNGLDPCDDIQTANKQFNMMGLGMKGFYTTIDPSGPDASGQEDKKTPHWSEINGCKEGTTKHCNGKSAYNGCDGHYNVKGHGVLARDIIPQFRQIMGW